MELLKGRTLEQILEEGRRFTVTEAVEIGIQLCGAISAVHHAGVLHRDIKSHNVILAEHGRVVLMDFGTGREMGDSSSAGLAGTPLYLAPARQPRAGVRDRRLHGRHVWRALGPALGRRGASRMRPARHDDADVESAGGFMLWSRLSRCGRCSDLPYRG